MASKNARAGNAGPKVRSDCEITLDIRNRGGIEIDLSSKVKSLYGRSIVSLCNEVLEFFDIRNAAVRIIDSGALPFVISARLEAAVKMLISTGKEFLPELKKENTRPGSAVRTRFSRLYIPGNIPSMMINAGLHSPDGIILDLEDSVAPDRKDEARILVRNALRVMDFRGAERMVRINQGYTGIMDLQYIIPQNVNMILIPKCDSAEDVVAVDKAIAEIRKTNKLKNKVFLMPIIESAAGVENSSAIAKASADVVAMAVGLEDLTADLGVPRTAEGRETYYARARVVMAAKAAGIQPIDSVFSDVGDMDGLTQNVQSSRAMGFEGMGCIHPRQIRVINDGFAPDAADIDKSMKIVLAFEDAGSRGLGVVTLGTKMIDAPVVERARKRIDLAIRLGLLKKNWKEELPGSGI